MIKPTPILLPSQHHALIGRRLKWLFPLVGLDPSFLGIHESRAETTNLISSSVWTGVAGPANHVSVWHAPTLDIDYPVELTRDNLLHIEFPNQPHVYLELPEITKVVPSKTPGHHHVFMDVCFSWNDYFDYLINLRFAGILHDGFVETSRKRGMSTVRERPWEKNTEAEEVMMVMLGYHKDKDGSWCKEAHRVWVEPDDWS